MVVIIIIIIIMLKTVLLFNTFVETVMIFLINIKFCNIKNVLTDTFDQFNALFLNKYILFFLN